MEVEVVLHNLELLGVDLDQAWVVEAENTGRVMMVMRILKMVFHHVIFYHVNLDSPSFPIGKWGNEISLLSLKK